MTMIKYKLMYIVKVCEGIPKELYIKVYEDLVSN